MGALPAQKEVDMKASSNQLAMEAKQKKLEIKKSPQVGFEPTTNRLTADRSTTELLKNLCLNFSIC